MNTAFVHFCRMASERVPGKPLRKVGGETLLKIATSKCPTNVVISPDQECYPDILSERKGRIWPELITPFISYFKYDDWIIDCNFICHPFLSESTIKTILATLQSLNYEKCRPLTFVRSERNVVWDENKNVILGRGQLADTKLNPLYYIPAHIAYCYRYEHLSWTEEQIAEKLVAFPITLSKLEQIDIDTEDDLILANLVWKGMQSGIVL